MIEIAILLVIFVIEFELLNFMEISLNRKYS